MSTEIACQALNEGRCLEIIYDGGSRTVEVHAVGYTKDGNAVMRVWQVDGASSSGQRSGWKLMRFDNAGPMGVSNESSQAPRQGYKRGDSVMERIIEEI